MSANSLSAIGRISLRSMTCVLRVALHVLPGNFGNSNPWGRRAACSARVVRGYFGLVPLSSGTKENGRDHVDHVDRRQGADGDRERIALDQHADDDRPETADTAADVEERVLRRGTGFRRIGFGHQRAVAAQHTVDEHAEQRAGPQHGGRVGQAGVKQHHQHGTRLEQQEARLPADAVGQLAEGPDAEHLPRMVTAVHIDGLVRLKPSCLERKFGIQIMMP